MSATRYGVVPSLLFFWSGYQAPVVQILPLLQAQSRAGEGVYKGRNTLPLLSLQNACEANTHKVLPCHLHHR